MPYEKRRRTFCNHSCAASSNNLKSNKWINTTQSRASFCLFCGSKIKKGKFCGNDHMKLYINKLKKEKEINIFEKITKEGVVAIYNHEVCNRRIAKKYLLKTRGHICEICKNTIWLNLPIPLVLDHVDGDATNYKLTNIRLVCGNCNMTLPTFAGRNVGKGKRKRINYVAYLGASPMVGTRTPNPTMGVQVAPPLN